MSRPRGFDQEAALEAAIQCFWRRGYHATSLRDLTAAMGLTAPSVYNAFGDKERLFAQALDRYLDRTTRERLRRLEEELPPKAAIQRFFSEIIEHSVNDPEHKGCLLVNSALEVAPHDADCRAAVSAQFKDLEAFFKRNIRRAQAEKSISADTNADDTGRLLLGVLLGIRVLARSRPERRVLEGVVRPALVLLDDPPGKRKGPRK
jgi:TetR/AcrR family transcriptional repressor of nem operon